MQLPLLRPLLETIESPTPAAAERPRERVVPRVEGRLFSTARIVSAVWPLAVALSFASNHSDTAHDAPLVRVLGLRGNGPFGFLDALVTAPFMLLPFGTRAYRAGIASAVAVMFLGLFVFEFAASVGRANLHGRAKDGPIVPIAALLASAAATLTGPVLLEGSTAGGSAWSAVFALAPAYVALRTPSAKPESRSTALAFLAGLAMSSHWASGMLALLTLIAFSPPRVRPSDVLAYALGLLPLLLCSTQAGGATFESSADVALTAARTWKGLLLRDIGPFALALSALGAFLALRTSEGRARTFGWGLSVLVLSLASFRSSAFGSARYDVPAILLAVVIPVQFASVVTFVVFGASKLHVPFAKATAVLLGMLFFAIPLRFMDEASYRSHGRESASSLSWERFAVATLPADSLYLTSDDRVWLRLRAGRLSGSLRDDIEVLPFKALSAKAAPTILREDPHLGALLRDFLLTGEPSENALSKVASERPVLLDFDRAWNPLLTKHLVPIGAFLKFESEPRGQSERRLALEKQVPERTRLAKDIMPDKEPELVALLARQMERRALALGVTGEHDSVSHAVDDLRAFAPRNALAEALVHRIVTARGAVDTRDLSAPF